MARVSKAVQAIQDLLSPEAKADWVTNKYVTWRADRQGWEADMRELRDYIFQTDTTETTNAQLPWKNKTSVPKICQLRDNLHANYFAALFPHDNWFKWESANEQGADKETARKIEAYMRQKIRESNFKEVISDALYDFIDYGNCFGEVTYESDVHIGPDGEPTVVYQGPVAHRISPYDIYFDITASTFKDAAKITRRIVSMGSLKRAAELNPQGFAWVEDALVKTRDLRSELSGYRDSDLNKSQGTSIDGFSNLYDYYSSDMVELLEFEGDIYIPSEGELQTGRRIIVMDRKWVVYDEPFDSWLGTTNKEHVSWRPRPDNLMGMGPLDNLVGMQYRLDHLENLKADVFDQIAHPVVVIKGMTEEWTWGPGERIFCDVDADVQILRPDATALNADFQMDRLMQNMEELAGAPKQAMGIRTPGEKTAFEVQALENAAGRIFQQKIRRFEEQFLEPMLNQFLAAARKHMAASEIVKVLDEDLVVEDFITVLKSDINAKGKLYPIGARHFAKQAQVIQNLLGMVNSAAYQDGSVNAHISGKKIAALFEEMLNLENFELVQDNIRVLEQLETQRTVQMAQEELMGDIQTRQRADEAFAEGPPEE